MHFCIFNNAENKISINDEIALIFTSLILAAKTKLFTLSSEFMSLCKAPETYTTEEKLKLYPRILKLFNNEANIEEINQILQVNISLKKLKHKNKSQLILYQHTINVINAVEKYIKSSVNLNLLAYNFEMLKEFANEGENSVFLYYNATTNYKEPLQVRRLVEFFSNAVFNVEMAPVLPEISFIKNINIIDINKNISLSGNSNIDVIEVPLFKIHSPLSFEAGQIKQIRTEIKESITAYYKNYANFGYDNCNTIFDVNSLPVITEFCKSNSDLLSKINSTLNQNIFLKQVPVNSPELSEYSIYLNFTSINNLLKIYNLYGIFPDYIITHIEKHMIKYADLNFLTYFLTIKKSEHD